MSVAERLLQLGIQLPQLPALAFNYVSARQYGSLVFSSGHTPTVNGELTARGKLGADVSLQQGQEAARLCVLNCLAAVAGVIGDLDRVESVPKLTGYVASAPGGPLVHRPHEAALAVLIGDRSLDPSVQRFIESTLGRILEYDADHHGDLLNVLRAYVTHPTNRTSAAKACHLSRSVFYQRLELIEQLLGIDLADGRSIATLHAAILAQARI
jgi:enamine deaminase RidA (YjgF/YER057c/UK114 family)